MTNRRRSSARVSIGVVVEVVADTVDGRPPFCAPSRSSSARTVNLDEPTLSTDDRVVVWRALPDVGQWAAATLLWTGAGLVTLWAAASRHREGRRA